MLRWLLERWRTLLVGGMLGAILFGGLRVLRGPTYQATSQFRPQSKARSPLAGLAQQFGISLGALGGFSEDESPFFYARLLATGELQRRAAFTNYRFQTAEDRPDTLEGTLVDLYGIRAGTRMELDRKVHDFMKKRVFVGVDARSELITVTTAARWPELAARVNRRFLELLNEYNLATRQSRARAERGFVEGRLAAAREDLEGAEAELERFLERNVQYQQSPELTFRAARLQRRVQLRQEVVTTLSQAFEEARVEEVRDTPVITLVDSPERSVREASGPLGAAVLGGVLGLLAALGVVATSDVLRRQRDQYPAEYAALERIVGDAVRTFRLGPVLAALRSRRRPRS
jgi:uncharacterized protein involved in exopolysaccharide biosynthesis